MNGAERSEVGTNWKKAADSAQLRSNIYGLLSTVFREEPTEALIHELRGPRLSGIFSDMGVELGEIFSSTSESAAAEALGLEFTRLFIGPGRHVSAHESVFAEMDGGTSSLWGRKTVEVKNFIETAGLDYQPEFTGIPDHVSVELEFMQKLTAWEAEKWTQQDRKSAEYCSTVQRLFLDQHLLCWLPQFCDAVMEQAELPFYRSMAELTRNYMEFESKGTQKSK
jgi:TorA maturation chaperone TorD